MQWPTGTGEPRASSLSRAAGAEWNVEWRASGAGMHGSADIRGFRAEVLEAHLRVGPSLLMESAIFEAEVGRDTNGNPRLDRRRHRGRIDALQAAVLAVGIGRRYRLPRAGGESRRVHRTHGEVFRDVRRVLRDDGTLWLNMSDSYVGNRRGSEGDSVGIDGSRHNQAESRDPSRAGVTAHYARAQTVASAGSRRRI